jgi:hypothetical protein
VKQSTLQNHFNEITCPRSNNYYQNFMETPTNSHLTSRISITGKPGTIGALRILVAIGTGIGASLLTILVLLLLAVWHIWDVPMYGGLGCSLVMGWSAFTAVIEGYKKPSATNASAVSVSNSAQAAVRPDIVSRALTMMWVSFGLELIHLGGNPVFANRDVATLIGAGIGAFLLMAPWAWAITRVARGRNWARILFLILYAIVVVLGAPFFRTLGPLNYETAIDIAQKIVAATIFVLLLMPSARKWFGAQHTASDGRKTETVIET